MATIRPKTSHGAPRILQDERANSPRAVRDSLCLVEQKKSRMYQSGYNPSWLEPERSPGWDASSHAGASCSESLIWVRMIWIWKSHVLQSRIGDPSYISAGFSDPHTHFFRFPNLDYQCSTEPLKAHADGKQTQMFCILVLHCIYTNNYFWPVRLWWLCLCSLQSEIKKTRTNFKCNIFVWFWQLFGDIWHGNGNFIYIALFTTTRVDQCALQ